MKEISGAPKEVSLKEVADKEFPTFNDLIARRREDTRQGIAYLVVGSFAFIVLSSFASFWFRGTTSVDDVVKAIDAIITPVIGIVGAVVGFYCGESQRNSK